VGVSSVAGQGAAARDHDPGDEDRRPIVSVAGGRADVLDLLGIALDVGRGAVAGDPRLGELVARMIREEGLP